MPASFFICSGTNAFGWEQVFSPAFTTALENPALAAENPATMSGLVAPEDGFSFRARKDSDQCFPAATIWPSEGISASLLLSESP